MELAPGIIVRDAAAGPARIAVESREAGLPATYEISRISVLLLREMLLRNIPHNLRPLHPSLDSSLVSLCVPRNRPRPAAIDPD